MSGEQPGAAEIAGWLSAVAEGRVDRDTADRWARRWVTDDALEWDEVPWRALNLLYGIDLRTGPDGPYLHSDEQVCELARELKEEADRSR
ncbi:hypothetical protein [Kitasatospora sp. CB01950]|uniref:hypothetical protein n=1 Tax=Kitasatospora sp. CB01950 TaxID=1703930 RepID=UPI00093AFD5A|nr:hypothetical protein [Kitasatospora sp. CB01950]OKI96779.1 hypothetical protein AMK19_32625 [Kitasatospora sp. CB01950]